MGRPFGDYEDYDAVGLAELIRTGEVKAAELVEAAIDRCERRNPQLNAVIRKDYDRARSAADRGTPTGPFGGVPFLVKDLVMEAKQLTNFGSVFFRTPEVTFGLGVIRTQYSSTCRFVMPSQSLRTVS